MNLKKLVLLIMPFFFVSIVSSASMDLGDYPYMFVAGREFHGIFAIADNAPAEDVVGISDIAMSLQYRSETTSSGTVTVRKIDVGSTKLASEVSDPNAQNLILVGRPKRDASDGNPLIDKFYSGTPQGGLIKLVKNSDYYVLIVTGDTTQNVREATKVLANYQDYDFDGMEINIDSIEKKQIELMPYDVKDTLTEGETKLYTINNVDYEVTVRYIKESEPYVSFRVNGEVTNALQVGQIYKISDGSKVQVTKVIPNSAGDITQDTVEFVFKGKEQQTKEEVPDDEKETIKEETTKHFLVVDDKGPVTDVVIISELAIHLASLGYTNIAPAKLNSEVTRGMLDDRVTTFVYLRKAVIITGSDPPSDHRTLVRVIEEFLEDEKGIKAEIIKSSDVKSDDLKDIFSEQTKKEDSEEQDIEPDTPLPVIPQEKDECNSNSDCDDNNACTSDLCSGAPKKCSNTETNIGCNYNGNCIPIGIRIENKYCDIDKKILDQKNKDEECNNNYECSTNLCINNKCISPSLIQKIINWFKRFFGA